VIDNVIDKSHENGIFVIGNDKQTRSAPILWRN